MNTKGRRVDRIERDRSPLDHERRPKSVVHRVQIGMQRRSAPAVIEAKEVVSSGVLGRITMVKPMWNRNVSRPLDNSPLHGKLDWNRFLGKAKDRDLTLAFASAFGVTRRITLSQNLSNLIPFNVRSAARNAFT